MKFPKEEVLNKKKAIVNRILDLQRALSLGNLEREKVKYIFMDVDGLKRVETTVWGITDASVILKESTIIPLERIVRVA
uniref:hypothetical protein n=1 Tax=uncultured Tenacibaculum sp. TaxID=174713 RepID=UPI00261707AD|nr:hypothetical protein [uncultured Tenacibaculum sp.]